MKAEAQALRLLAKKDRAGLEALVLASRRALAALDVLEGVAPVELVEEPAAPRAPMTDAERSREYRRRHAPPSRRRDGERDEPSRQRDAARDGLRDGAVTVQGGVGGDSPSLSLVSPRKEDPKNTEQNTQNARASVTPTVTDSVTRPSRPHPDTFFDGSIDAALRTLSPTGKHAGVSNAERGRLAAAIDAHADECADRVTWAVEAVTAYLAICDDKFRRRTVEHWIKWLNEGRPTAVTATPTRGPRVQGGPPAAPLGTSRRNFNDIEPRGAASS